MRYKQDRWGILLVILFAILILILSILPSDISKESPRFFFRGMDKIIHAMMYGAFTYLALNEFLKNFAFRKRSVLIIIVAVFSYSVLMEILQLYLVESRSGEWLDILANLTGILVGLAVILLREKIRS